ncbi:unnamed protein product [Amaranthus hypochondriacus]
MSAPVGSIRILYMRQVKAAQMDFGALIHMTPHVTWIFLLVGLPNSSLQGEWVSDLFADPDATAGGPMSAPVGSIYCTLHYYAHTLHATSKCCTNGLRSLNPYDS